MSIKFSEGMIPQNAASANKVVSTETPMKVLKIALKANFLPENFILEIESNAELIYSPITKLVDEANNILWELEKTSLNS
jgi:hypothetical protein